MKLTTDAKIVLLVIGCLEELRIHGLIDGPCMMLPQGTSEYDQIKASGLRPSSEDLHGVLLAVGINPREIPVVSKLARAFLSGDLDLTPPTPPA